MTLAKKLAYATLGFLACAGQGDIDRTQANKLPKSLFQGTWYMRPTITDLPPNAATGFIGLDGDMEKVVWEIQEDYLIAWRAYEELPGADRERIDEEGTLPFHTEPANPGDVANTPDYADNPIAAFPIVDHIDVKRDYNASTGEQTNVILENKTDRPWYEREYIRVDWSSQQLTNPFRYFSLNDRVELQYYVQPSEGGDDALRILSKETDDEGNTTDVALDFDNVLDNDRPDGASAYYFDMVGRLFIEPATIRFANGFTIPLCWFYPAWSPAPGVTCGPTYMEVRTSFLKVDPSHEDFEPHFMDDQDLGRFGYFRTERMTYNRNYGLTESGRIYLANHHNIWKNSYQCSQDATGNCERDANGNLIFTTNDMGDRIPIPLEDRTPKPIVYHLSPNYPAELLDITKEIGRDWNRSFRQAVAVAKGCLTSSVQNVDDIPTIPPPDKSCYVPDMYLVHGNGWQERYTDGNGDPQTSDYLRYDMEAGQSDYTYDPTHEQARYGDIRYSMIAWVDNYHVASPHGFGPSSADPETGEIITGSAYVYSHVTDRYAQDAVDIIRTLNGDLDIDELVDADYIRGQIDANSTPLDPSSLPSELSAIPSGDAANFLLGDQGMANLAQVQEMLASGKIANQNPLMQQERLDHVRGTLAEDYLYNGEVVKELIGMAMPDGLIPSVVPPLTDEMRVLIDPLTMVGPDILQFEQYRQDFASRHNVWLEEFTDSAIMGLAMQYKGRTDYDQIWKEIRDLIYEDVMLHEIGHTVGLRHNFAGSYDSLNYFDKYWELRDENLLHLTPDDYWYGQNGDPISLQQEAEQFAITENQIAQRMPEYQYSTVMDYGARFNSAVHGLGKYDTAAVMFGYTGFVEAFDPETYVVDEFDRLGSDDEEAQEEQASNVAQTLKSNMWRRFADCTPAFEARTSPILRSPVETYHYSRVPDMLFGRDNLVDEDFASEPWRGLRYRSYAKWADVRPLVEAATEECRAVIEALGGPECDPDDIYDANSECTSLVSEEWTLANEQEFDRPVVVPYQFCGDEYANTSQSCLRWDHGADPYEQVLDKVESYRNYYWFTHFKRDRTTFNPIQVFTRVQTRYFSYFITTYQQLLISPIYDSMLNDYFYFGMYAGFSELLDAATIPEYGTYGFDEEEAQWEPQWKFTNQPTPVSEMFLDRGPAKNTWTDWDVNDGYMFVYKPAEIGHFYDYVGAMLTLTRPTASVLNVQSQNVGSYYLPYYLVFPETLERYFEGIATISYDQYAPRMIDGKPVYVHRGVELNDGSLLDATTWQPIADPSAGFPVETMSSLSFRYYAMLFGMAFFPIFDNEFLYRNKVAIVGTGEELIPGPGFVVETFTDPETGTQYGAVCNPLLPDDMVGGACKMMYQGQEYSALCPNSEDDDTQNYDDACDKLDTLLLHVDMMRHLYDVFGYGNW